MKLTITLGIDTKGNARVLAGPDADTDGQRDKLRELTDRGGKIKSGKSTIQLVEAAVFNTAKGIIGKSRKF